MNGLGLQVLSSRVILHPADLAASRRFYEEVLGLSVYREWGVGVAFFLGGGFLELSSVGEAGGPSTLWLQIPSLEGVEVALQALLVTVVKSTERMGWGLVELWVQDPDGNGVRLVEVPADHPLRRR